MSERNSYWLKRGDGDWVQVSVEEWVRAERAAGFHNTLGHDDRPATAGFGSTTAAGSISGTSVHDDCEEKMEAETPGAFDSRWSWKGQQFVQAWQSRNPDLVEER